MAPPYNLHNTFGALFVGLIVAATLHGVSIVQAMYYYTHQNDKWGLKTLVAAVMIFDTVHQALITHTVYTYSITYWGAPEELQKLVWSLVIECLFNGIIGLLVQSFLTLRVWRLSNGKIILTSIIALLVLGEFVSLLVFTILVIPMKNFVELAPLNPLSNSINAFAVSGDVLIAGALCVLLHRSRSGFQKSDTMINKLIVFSVNTGLLTSLFAIASFISNHAAPDCLYYIAFFICMGRLYTNSLLATLNARDLIRKSADTVNYSTADNKVNVSLREFPKNESVTPRQAANISIKINTTKDYVTDSISERDMDKTVISGSPV